jgi:hypothetical protein
MDIIGLSRQEKKEKRPALLPFGRSIQPLPDPVAADLLDINNIPSGQDNLGPVGFLTPDP